MVALLFAAAIGVALATLSLRRAARWQRRKRLLSEPGRTVERPLTFARFDEIDAALASARCDCGGGLEVLGEGSATAAGLEGRVVRCACRTCEEEHFLYFRRRDIPSFV